MPRANHLDEPTNEVGELKITYATELEGDWAEIAMVRQKFAWYPPSIHSMNQETRHKIIEGNKFMMQRQKAKYPSYWKWGAKYKWDILFNPMLFMMHNGVLCYWYTDPAEPYNALRICILKVKLKEAFQICHKGIISWEVAENVIRSEVLGREYRVWASCIWIDTYLWMQRELYLDWYILVNTEREL